MRRALAIACSLLVAGCAGGGAKGASGSHADARAEDGPVERPAVDPAKLVAACADHLLLLHRRRLARELGPELSKLAGPTPSVADFDASLTRLREAGVEGTERDFAGAGSFANVAAPALEGAGYAFIAWTPVLEDVGLAKVAARRPGAFPSLYGKAMSYEVLVLDGFKVPDYPRFREETLEHAESAAELPRRRGSLLVVDKASLAADAEKVLADKKPDRADLRAAVERAGIDGLVREAELREACYLRFQDELRGAGKLDRAATWLEVAEGDPDLALSGGAISAGDRPDERRRATAIPTLFIELARAGATKDDLTPVLRLPREERTKKLKELAPGFVKFEVEH